MDDPIQQMWNQIDETTVVLWDQLDETTTAYTGFPASTVFGICILFYSIWLLLGPAFNFLFSGGVDAIDLQSNLTRTLTPVDWAGSTEPLFDVIDEPPEQPTPPWQDTSDELFDVIDEPLVPSPPHPPEELITRHAFDEEDVTTWYDWDDTLPMPSATATTTSINSQLVVMTEEALLQFNGRNEGTPLYVAVLGDIYDVTKSRDLYGPGKAYDIFAGKHISRALAKWSLAPENRTGYKGGLSRSEIKRLDHWKRKFDRKYTKVGSIYGPH